jgi:hypothetical protein
MQLGPVMQVHPMWLCLLAACVQACACDKRATLAGALHRVALMPSSSLWVCQIFSLMTAPVAMIHAFRAITAHAWHDAALTSCTPAGACYESNIGQRHNLISMTKSEEKSYTVMQTSGTRRTSECPVQGTQNVLAMPHRQGGAIGLNTSFNT